MKLRHYREAGKLNPLNRGFTIVELLIVIVVIGILAAITIVAYNGVTDKAKVASMKSDLANTNQQIMLYLGDNNVYPTALTQLNSGVGVKSSNGNIYGYTSDATVNPPTYCLTVMNGTLTPSSISQAGNINDGACPFTTGDQTYCPEGSYVKLNGYYCDGTTGSTANLNSSSAKQVSTASGVPAGSPTYYVGVETTRDNLIGGPFTVVAGESYCFSGYAATSTSTVVHTIGFMLNGSGMGTTWLGVNNLSPFSTWQKMSGCITVPSGYTTAQFWTQNNGDPASTAQVPWYQTALMITKQ